MELKEKLDKIDKTKNKQLVFLEAQTALKETGETTLPVVHAKRNERGITDELYRMVLKRGRHLEKGELDKIKETDKEIKKCRRAEKREYHKKITREERPTSAVSSSQQYCKPLSESPHQPLA